MGATWVAPSSEQARAGRIGFWQVLMVTLLFTGYGAYYFCRSDLSVAMPLFIDQLAKHGMSHTTAFKRAGSIASFGVLAYAIGKFLLAGLADIWGGRRSFLVGLGGAAVCTVIFAFGGVLPIFTLAWVGNRFIQAMGWAGLVKVCSRWFSYSAYGTVLGILSLSFLIGDAAARQSMGMLLGWGYGLRGIFLFAASVGLAAWLANALWLRDTRTELGFGEPEFSPLSVSHAQEGSDHPTWRAILMPLLSDRAFWVVCALSFGCTIVRETFNLWTPEYLSSYVGFGQAASARLSSVFPAAGAVSVLLMGWLSDRLGTYGRPTMMFIGLSAAVGGLIALTQVRPHAVGETPVILIGVLGFSLLGPYAYLAGAMALDFGGRRAGGASSGIIDGVGYLGGVLAGDSVARVEIHFGWQGVFWSLAAISAASALAAAYLFFHQRSERWRRCGGALSV
jgi:OPA family glycerol-3-phosphate transporter-like MFS transporter